MGLVRRGDAQLAHPPQVVRSGFVALAGRPNVGKSTLANAIVGAKVAIVSDKPQTTRRAIRGVATGPDWQLVLVDLPGVQRPRDALTERMQHRVEHELVVGAVGHAADGPPRRLRFVGHDRHLGADDRVGERGLADVGAPGEGDEARARRPDGGGRVAHRRAAAIPVS